MGRCQNGVFAITSPCAGGLSCQVLPLVNKPGTSVACDTESDKIARFTAAGVGASVPEAVAPPVTPAAAPPVVSQAEPATTGAAAVAAGGNKAGDFVCIDGMIFAP